MMIAASPLAIAAAASASYSDRIRTPSTLLQRRIQDEYGHEITEEILKMKMITYVDCSNSQPFHTDMRTTATPTKGQSSSSTCQIVLMQEKQQNHLHSKEEEEQNQFFVWDPLEDKTNLIVIENPSTTIPVANRTCNTVHGALSAMSMASSSSSLPLAIRTALLSTTTTTTTPHPIQIEFDYGQVKIQSGSVCSQDGNVNIGDVATTVLPSFPISIEGMGLSPKDVVFDCSAPVEKRRLEEEKTNILNNKDDDDSQKKIETEVMGDRAFVMSMNGIHHISNLSIRNCLQLPQVTPPSSSTSKTLKLKEEEENYSGYGGAILVLQNNEPNNNSSNVTIENVVFQKNQALMDGGAIAVMMKMNDINNTAVAAAATAAANTAFVVRSCLFDDNRSFHAGGAVHIHTLSSLSFSSSSSLSSMTSFFQNNGRNNEGAFHERGSKSIAVSTKPNEQQQYSIQINNCTYANNRARVHGGAISLVSTVVIDSGQEEDNYSKDNDKAMITTNFTECKFHRNSAQAGGAIHTLAFIHRDDTPLKSRGKKTMPSTTVPVSRYVWNGTFHDCTFEENLARWRGGAVYLHSSSNPPPSYNKKKSYGGSDTVVVAAAAGMIFSDSTFTKNVAAGNSSSSICNNDFDRYDYKKDYNDDDEHYDNNCFESEEGGAGGGLYVEDSELGLHGCLFDNNEALDFTNFDSSVANGARGGAVSMKLNSPFFSSSSFWQPAFLVSSSTEFRSNSAKTGNSFQRPAQGGAVWIGVSGGPGGYGFQTNNPMAQYNKLEVHRKALADTKPWAITQFTNALFNSNEATSETPSIVSNVRRMTGIDAPISNKGGGVFIIFSRREGSHFSKGISSQSIASFVSTVFQKNAADFGGMGGGIYLEGGQHNHLILLNSTFTSNAAISTPYFPGAGGGLALIDGGKFSIKGCHFNLNYASPHVSLNFLNLGSQGRSKYAGTNTKKSGFLDLTSNFWETLASDDSKEGPFLSHDSSLLHWFPDAECLSGQGGAIHLKYASSESSIESTLFHRNFCGSGDGGIDSGPKGGAVDIMSASKEQYGGNHPMPTMKCLAFTDVLFSQNAAIASSNAMSSQMIFLDGSSSGRGGAVHVNHAAPCFSKCAFSGNTATAGRGERPALGGAVDLFLTSGNVPFEQCIFTHNSVATPHRKNDAHGNNKINHGREEINERSDYSMNRGYLSMQTGRGGAVSVIGSSISMNNCTIINNTAFESANTPVPSIGGGIYIDSSSKCNVSYTSFRGNNAGGFGDDVCSINSGLARKNPSSMFIDTSTSDANTANGKVTLSIVSSTFEIEQNNQETSRDLQRKNNEEEQRYSLLLLGGNTILGNPNCSVFLTGSGDDIVSLIDGQDSVDGDVVLSSASLHIIEEKEFYSGKLQSYFSLWSKNASLFFNSSTNGDSKARLRSLVMINSNLTSLLKGIIVEADATLIDVILSSLEDSYISEFEVLGKTDIGDSANKEVRLPVQFLGQFEMNVAKNCIYHLNPTFNFVSMLLLICINSQVVDLI